MRFPTNRVLTWRPLRILEKQNRSPIGDPLLNADRTSKNRSDFSRLDQEQRRCGEAASPTLQDDAGRVLTRPLLFCTLKAKCLSKSNQIPCRWSNSIPKRRLLTSVSGKARLYEPNKSKPRW